MVDERCYNDGDQHGEIAHYFSHLLFNIIIIIFKNTYKYFVMRVIMRVKRIKKTYFGW